jgi:FKBP-type peptidyl-prolyl cis-trans isomerase
MSVTPPGASIPKVSPDVDPSQAIGEAAASTPTASAKPAEVKAAETKAAEPPKAVSAPPAGKGEVKTTSRGVKYETIKEGTGPSVNSGQRVSVHYVGTFTDGRSFDSSRPRNEPLEFVLGAPGLIDGWGEGIPGMKVGEIRKLTIPPDLAYGPQGRPGAIPPNSTLVFEIELLSIK